MGTKLHWTMGPWLGRLAMAARPRGGEWLDDEMTCWKQAGVDTVVSFLETAEEAELELAGERESALAHGMSFVALPMVDRSVPESEARLLQAVDTLDKELGRGRNVVLHCRQGVGRTGLVAACLLMAQGFTSAEAVARLSDARGIAIPETPAQRGWIDRHAEAFAATR